MSAQADPDDLQPNASSDAVYPEAPRFAVTAFCPRCQAQSVGQEPYEVGAELLAHLAFFHL